MFAANMRGWREIAVTARQRSGGESWFTPRAPDQAVRRWAETLLHSGSQHVLDVGCGGGRHVVYLLRLGLQVTAGDLSAPALEETRRWLAREGLNAGLVQFDMAALPFPDNTFDGVLSVNVLHHAQPAEARMAVREVSRVLRPGGLFLAVLAGPGNCQCLLQRPGLPGARNEPGACTANELRDLFDGFRVLSTQRRTLRLPPGSGPPAWQGVNWRVWAERP
ncbi:MAG: class I SAM-dependent methyltransferase [Anaerolineae bacterium]